MIIAVTPTDKTTSLTPSSVPVLTRAARTPAREILAVHSCAATSSRELSLGDTGALRLATQEYTHRLPTSLTGSCPTCKPTICQPNPPTNTLSQPIAYHFDTDEYELVSIFVCEYAYR